MQDMPRRLVIVGLTIVCALVSGAAAAQPRAPASDAAAKATARSFADKGLTLYNEGKYREAVEALAPPKNNLTISSRLYREVRRNSSSHHGRHFL